MKSFLFLIFPKIEVTLNVRHNSILNQQSKDGKIDNEHGRSSNSYESDETS